MFEHPSQLNITQSELAPRVADYFDNLLAQRDAILARYNLTPETAEKFCDLQSTDKDRETILALYEKIVYVIEHKQIPPHEKQGKLRMAQEIMKEDFLGIEAVEKTFNIHLDPADIPDIPFSIEEIKRAQELGQFLILRVDKTDDDTPLTMEQMENMLADSFDREGNGRIIWSYAKYRNEDLFTTEIPRLSWALVSKDIIPNSTKKNYLEQTTHLIDYLKNEVYQGKPFPPVWQDAIDEFEKEKDRIAMLIKTNWQEATIKLEQLSITSLARHTPVEVLYDFLVYFMNTEVRLWEKVWTWTGCCNSDGELMNIGLFDSGGAGAGGHEPDYSDDFLGVSFSRLR